MSDKTGSEYKTLTIRREMRVGWFAVKQLLATLSKVLTSTIVGSMAGRRELLAALDPQSSASVTEHDFSDRSEMWLDYIADTGDGFDASHSVAWLAGRRTLKLGNVGQATAQQIPTRNPEGDPTADGSKATILLAGEVLILGGDQVYPTASGEAYQGRLIDPFQSALFYQPKGRAVYAIPGNHDWYDGLNAFVALFCQGATRWIGGWQTRQRRSYFCLKLPYGWWLWAFDMALEDDLDAPQLQYFRNQATNLREGEKVILCVPSPTWIKREGHQAAIRKGGVGDRDVEREIQRYDLITQIVTNAKATTRICLSGDLHFYAHHSSEMCDYIVCGGGGAFALGTNRTPETLPAATPPASLKAVLPEKAESNRRRWLALWFAKLSPGFTFGLTLIQLLICYAFNLASELNPNAHGASMGWVEMLRATPSGFGAIFAIAAHLFNFLPNAPITIGILVITLVGFVGFADSGSLETTPPILARICGVLHWLLHMILGLSVAFFAAKIGATPGLWGYISFILIDATCIFLLGGLLFGTYLLLTNILFGLHEQEVFSCQSIEDYKCFLRIHIDQHALTIYPIGIDKISKKWKPAPGVKVQARKTNPDLSMAETVIVPAHASRIYDPVTPLKPKLIEEPIRIEHG